MRKARAKKTDTNNNNNRDLPSTNLILIPFSSLQWGAYLSTNLQYKYYNCIWYNQQQVQLPRCSTLNKINLRIQPTRESNSLRCLPQNRFWSWAWRYWWTGWIKRTFCSRSCGLVAVGVGAVCAVLFFGDRNLLLLLEAINVYTMIIISLVWLLLL